MDKIDSDNPFEIWARQTGVVRSHAYREDSERLFEGLRSRVEQIDDALIEECVPAVQFDAAKRIGTSEPGDA